MLPDQVCRALPWRSNSSVAGRVPSHFGDRPSMNFMSSPTFRKLGKSTPSEPR